MLKKKDESIQPEFNQLKFNLMIFGSDIESMWVTETHSNKYIFD